ncbi:TPA: hypothetical protein HA361_03180 [Candidatus Woesearchaeota archaeon]|nr:hypothetical protein [Candidatus Woesearchaeota archaeon]HII69110.1 hypothetical protein [Candidatus Woesearchaeota archaeon]
MKTKKAALAAGHCRSHLLRFECCTLGYEGWMPDAEHDGISNIRISSTNKGGRKNKEMG